MRHVQERLWALVLALALGLLAASCGGSSDTDLPDASFPTDGQGFSTSHGGCLPTSCQSSGYTCGKNADGCGDLVDCGVCGGADFCGGGGFSRCGIGDGGTPAASAGCVPKACADLGLTCGRNADGCGGVVDCGTCSAPSFCGGAGFSRCGATSVDGGPAPACVPTTCPALGAGCGTAGDGCGGALDCGSCGAPAFCGGGGFSVCGGHGPSGSPSACPPATCQTLGFDCGPAGDGCVEPPSVRHVRRARCLRGAAAPPACAATTAPALCTQQVACAGVPTTITGRVLAGVSSWVPPGTTPDPVPNAIVYVPSAALQPFQPGAQCTQCGADVSGSPLVATTSAFDGTFALTNVPVGTHIPVVVQLGRWRREFFFDVTTSCASTSIGDLHLPRTQSEGDDSAHRHLDRSGGLDRVHLAEDGRRRERVLGNGIGCRRTHPPLLGRLRHGRRERPRVRRVALRLRAGGRPDGRERLVHELRSAHVALLGRRVPQTEGRAGEPRGLRERGRPLLRDALQLHVAVPE